MSRRSRSFYISASLIALVAGGSELANQLGARAVRDGLARAGARADAVQVSSLTGRVTLEGVRFAALGGDARIGRIVVATGNGLVTPAFAQSGSSYTIEGLKIEQPLVSFTVPSIQIEGASIGKDEWLKLFSFDAGLPERLKSLNLTGARVPSIEFRADMKTGGRIAYALKEIRIENVRAGRAERMVVAGGSFESDAPGMKQDGTLKPWEIRGLDLAQGARVWFATAKDGEKPLPLYDTYVIEGMTSNAQGDVIMTMEFGKMTASSLRMRPLKGRSLADVTADLMAYAERTKDKPKADKNTKGGKVGKTDDSGDAEMGRKLIPALTEALEAIEDDGMAGENVRMFFGEKGKPTAEFTLAKFSGSYGSATVPSGFLLSDMAFKGGDYTARLAEFGISGFSYIPMLRGMAEAMAGGDPDFNNIDPRKMMPKFGSTTLKGFEIEGPAPKSPKGVKPERIALKLGQIALAARNEVNGIPTDLSFAIDNLAMKLPETPSEEGLKTLRALGYSTIDMSAKVAAKWDEAKKEIGISDLSFGGAQMGQVRLTGTFGNVGREVFEADAAMAQVALMGATAKTASLKIDNAGLAEKLIAMQARQQGRKPEEVRTELGMMAAMGIPALLGPSDEAKAIAGAISKFLAKPKGLSVNLAARNALGIGVPDMVMASDPQAALKLVTVKASAED